MDIVAVFNRDGKFLALYFFAYLRGKVMIFERYFPWQNKSVNQCPCPAMFRAE